MEKLFSRTLCNLSKNSIIPWHGRCKWLQSPLPHNLKGGSMDTEAAPPSDKGYNESHGTIFRRLWYLKFSAFRILRNGEIDENKICHFRNTKRRNSRNDEKKNRWNYMDPNITIVKDATGHHCCIQKIWGDVTKSHFTFMYICPLCIWLG